MADEKIVISNSRSGWEKDVYTFLLPKDGYATIINAYPYRGRTELRKGAEYIDRIVQLVSNQTLGTANGSSFTATISNIPIQPASVEITVGALTFLDNGLGVLFTNPSSLNTGTINYQTGNLTLSFNPDLGGPTSVIALYNFYNCLPCMGIKTREILAINREQTIVFDTQKANVYQNSVDAFRDITLYRVVNKPFSWTGSNSQFFWTSNYQGGFFATNNVIGRHFFNITNISTSATSEITFTSTTGSNPFAIGDKVFFLNVKWDNTSATGPNGKVGKVTAISGTSSPYTVTTDIVTTGFDYSSGSSAGLLQSPTKTISGDGIRWFDSGSGEEGWANFQPPVNFTQCILAAKGIIPFQGRLLVFSPTLGTAQTGNDQVFYNRIYWSSPTFGFYNNMLPTTYPANSDPNCWNTVIPGNGGYLTGRDNEQIISMGLLNNTMIVRFERSTARLDYTGSIDTPFVLNYINSEQGVESTFSHVFLDSQDLGVSNIGINSCDTNQVQRIDQKIPDNVFEINNSNQGPDRVYGIRDYTKQLVYWTYPDSDKNPVFPTNVFVYNYLDQSWGFFEDSVTCFGYLQPFNDLTWANLKKPWNIVNQTWGYGALEEGFPFVVGGNQQGFVFKFNAQQITNDPTLYISNITKANPCVVTSPNHNMQSGQFIIITDVQGMSQVNNNVYIVKRLDANSFVLQTLENGVYSPIDSRNYSTYIAISGLISLRSNFNITTKEFSPFIEEGLQCRLSNIDVFINSTNLSNGQFTINIYKDQNLNAPVQTKSVTPTSTETFVWKRSITNSRGQFITVEFTFSDKQMFDPSQSSLNFALQSMILDFLKGSRLVYGDR